jgi:hypothetical protein
MNINSACDIRAISIPAARSCRAMLLQRVALGSDSKVDRLSQARVGCAARGRLANGDLTAA